MIKPILKHDEECPACNGEGEIWFTTIIGVDHKPCDDCNGTGKL